MYCIYLRKSRAEADLSRLREKAEQPGAIEQIVQTFDEMKKIIKNKVYDTDTAQKCGEWDNGYHTNDFYFFGETLYRKKTGEFFLHGEGHALSKYAGHSGNSSGWGEQIIPLSYSDAQAWAEQHLDGDTYISIFGEPDDEKVGDLHVRISAQKMAKLRKAASQAQVSLVEMIERLIDTV